MKSIKDGEDENDSPIGGLHKETEHEIKRRVAEEIASGVISGMFERDEEILEMVREIREKG